MPLRHSFRRRALSNGLTEEGRPSRKNHLSDLPPLPLSCKTGLNRTKRGGSSVFGSNKVFHCDEYALGASEGQAQGDDTTSEVYASIWRPSLYDQEDPTPPTSPSRFLFAHTSSIRSRPGIAKIRQGSFKKCFTSPSFPGVSSLLRLRGKRDKKEDANIGATSFLDFSASKDELSLHPTGRARLRHTSSEWPLFTPPKTRHCDTTGSTSTATVSPSICQTPHSSASSFILRTPESVHESIFGSELPSTGRLPTSSSSNKSTPPPNLSSSSLEPFPRYPLESPRSFEKLRGSLTWNRRGSTISRLAAPSSSSKRLRNRSGLPPLSPPPTDKLPPPPPHSKVDTLGNSAHKQRGDTLQPTFLQWERELKDLSISLHEETHLDNPIHLRVNQSIKRSMDMDRSTPSTITPAVLTPRAEAFEFDLDESARPSSPASRLSPVPLLCRAPSTSAPPTADSSFTQAMHSFPSPPLRDRSSSMVREGIDQSSASYHSAESDVDPFSTFSTSPGSGSSSRILLPSHQRHHIDSLTTSTHCTASLYTSACDRYPRSSDDQH